MRMTLSLKLYTISALTVVGLALVTALSLYIINHQVNASEAMVQGDAAQVDFAMKSQVNLAEAVRAYKNYLIRKDDKQVAIFHESVTALEKNIGEFARLANAAEEKAAADKATSELGTYRGRLDELVAARQASDDVTGIDRTLARGISTG